MERAGGASLFAAYPRRDGRNFVELPAPLKAKGSCTTEQSHAPTRTRTCAGGSSAQPPSSCASSLRTLESNLKEQGLLPLHFVNAANQAQERATDNERYFPRHCE